jgi:hypothetical protein
VSITRGLTLFLVLPYLYQRTCHFSILPLFKIIIVFVGCMWVTHMDPTHLSVIFKSRKMGEGHEQKFDLI